MTAKRNKNQSRKNAVQVNSKQTRTEWKKLQEINETFFDGQFNKSDLARVLFQIAEIALKKGLVEVKQAGWKIDGKEVQL